LRIRCVVETVGLDHVDLRGRGGHGPDHRRLGDRDPGGGLIAGQRPHGWFAVLTGRRGRFPHRSHVARLGEAARANLGVVGTAAARTGWTRVPDIRIVARVGVVVVRGVAVLIVRVLVVVLEAQIDHRATP
jgi:hypothetical protein